MTCKFCFPGWLWAVLLLILWAMHSDCYFMNCAVQPKTKPIKSVIAPFENLTKHVRVGLNILFTFKNPFFSLFNELETSVVMLIVVNCCYINKNGLDLLCILQPAIGGNNQCRQGAKTLTKQLSKCVKADWYSLSCFFLQFKSPIYCDIKRFILVSHRLFG